MLEVTPSTGALVGVQGERRVRTELVLAPELRPEAFGHAGCVVAPFRGSRASEGIKDFRAHHGGLVGVGLDLGQRDGPLRERTVVPADGVAGVLPALVHQAGPGLVQVFQEAVPVQVAVVPEPLEGVRRLGRSSSTSASGMPAFQASCRRQIHSGVASMVP